MAKLSDRKPQAGIASAFRPRDWQPTAPAGAGGGGGDGKRGRFSAISARSGIPVSMTADLDRVLKLPRRPVLDMDSPRGQAMVSMITRRYSNGRAAGAGCKCRSIDPSRPCITTLLPVQALALYEIGVADGLLGSIPVGAGKTIIGILALLALKCKNALMLIPPQLIDQLWIDYQLLEQHFHVPSISFNGSFTESNIIPGQPTLYVLPYSLLQRPESSVWITNLKPEAIISDECDRLKDPSTATTSRVLRYFYEFADDDPATGWPGVKFCGWTGSITDKSITEFAHLAALALKFNSPMPLDSDVVDEWAGALDADGDSEPGALTAFCDNPNDASMASVRRGFNRRLAETQGIVISTSGTVTVEGKDDQELDIDIRERKPPPIPASVMEHLKLVREKHRRPDGEELTDAMSVAKCASEVAAGLYYHWRYPLVDGEEQDEDLIEYWFEKRQDWNRELRTKLLNRADHMDSEMLCRNAAERAWGDRPKDRKLPEWKAETWPAWRDVKDRVKYIPEAVRIDPYLVDDAIAWGRQHRGIIWYGLTEFGEWCAERSRLTGPAMPMHGGGPKAGARLRAERGDRSIIASIKSHGRGRNGLQFLFDSQLIAQPPSSSSMIEQLLGRLHRRGQASDVVQTWVYQHTRELKRAIEQAMGRAEYVEGILGARQKLLVGNRGL